MSVLLTGNCIEVSSNLAGGDIAISCRAKFLGRRLSRLEAILHIVWIQLVLLLFGLLWVNIRNTQAGLLQWTLLLQYAQHDDAVVAAKSLTFEAKFFSSKISKFCLKIKTQNTIIN